MRKLPAEVIFYKVKYWAQLDQAKRRGISWLFTFETWFKVWSDSGHLHERGRRKGQYVMARFGDRGPYSVDNVKITTVEENSIEANFPTHREIRRGYKQSDAAKEKIRLKALGRVRSEEAKQKTSATLKSNAAHIQACTDRILAQTKKNIGSKRSDEARQNMRNGIALSKLKQKSLEIA